MANLFPVIEVPAESENEAAESGSSVSFGRSWRFNYEAGEFMMTPTGKVSVAEDADAWIEWCRKALQTERYRHVIYSRDHGQEFDGLIGSGLSRSAIESEIRRIATETLMNDPRTAGVDDFSFHWEVDRCYFSCAIKNVRDETGTITGSVVNG